MKEYSKKKFKKENVFDNFISSYFNEQFKPKGNAKMPKGIRIPDTF